MLKQNNKNIDRKLVQSFVPVNALSGDHLSTLLRDRSIEYLYKGQRLFELGENDNCNIYLLHGKIELIDLEGNVSLVSSEDASHLFPIAHYQPRRSIATAKSDCSILRFDTTVLDNMLCWDQTASCIISDIGAYRDLDEDAQWMEMLLRSNLFYKVPPTNIRNILGCFEALYMSAEDVVVRQGERGDCCYIIKEGSVDVFQSAESQGPASYVATLGVGRCFGEDALLNETLRNATVIMRENGVLMSLGKADFYKLLKQPQVESVCYSQVEEKVLSPGQWVDVRTTAEYDFGHRQGAKNLPLNVSKLKARMLDKNIPYIAYCNTGTRSEAAVWQLNEEGYNIKALRGGINGLSRDQQLDFDL